MGATCKGGGGSDRRGGVGREAVVGVVGGVDLEQHYQHYVLVYCIYISSIYIMYMDTLCYR